MMNKSYFTVKAVKPEVAFFLTRVKSHPADLASHVEQFSAVCPRWSGKLLGNLDTR